MTPHLPDEIRQKAHGLRHVRTLVEHHAFGPLPHGGVGGFRAAGQSFLDEIVQDLGGPDHRNSGGLAQPKHFFLNLGQSQVAQFDREIAAGDHDRGRARSGRLNYQLRQVADRIDRFDFKDERHRGAPWPDRLDRAVEVENVLGSLDERKADDVRMHRDGGERREVIGG